MAEDAQAATIAVKQINLGYHPQVDRLLLKLGLSDQSELQVWLTYRVAKTLWAYLREDNKLPSEETSNPETVPELAVEQFEEEVKAVETLNQLDFATAYDDKAYQTKTHKVKDRNSGEEKSLEGPLLAVKAVKQGETPNVTIVFTCSNGFNLNLNLNADLSLAVFTMLQMSAKEAEWPLSESAVTSAPSMVIKEDSNQTVH